MQQAFQVDEVFVVVVVEGGRSLEVQRGEVCVPGSADAWAARLLRRRKGGVDVGIVVDVRAEACAP